MDSNSKPEIAQDFSPFLRIYQDGTVERLMGVEFAPPSTDPITGVQCKDVKISAQDNISARVYLPKLTNPTQKLPLLVYFHGGGFCIESPFSPGYHNYVSALVAESNVIAISVDYRLAPEHPLPIAYHDSWAAIKWVASHKDGKGSEEWLNNLADLERMFFAGDSAGANIAHHMAIKVKEEKLDDGVQLQGIVLIHPYFWGKEPIGKEPVEPEKRAIPAGLWLFACPTTSGCDDPLINPDFDPNVSKLGCRRVLVCVAEKDVLRERNWRYKDILDERGWEGDVEILETEGADHVFHLQKPTCEGAVTMLKKIALFLH